MNEIKLEIKDYYILLNLHKALLEAKFHMDPDNIEVCYSPIIADLCNELVDLLIKLDGIKDEKNIAAWEDWRNIATKSFFRERAVKNAALYKGWLEKDEEEKVRSAKILLSPFKATEEEIKAFIEDVDKEFVRD